MERVREMASVERPTAMRPNRKGVWRERTRSPIHPMTTGHRSLYFSMGADDEVNYAIAAITPTARIATPGTEGTEGCMKQAWGQESKNVAASKMDYLHDPMVKAPPNDPSKREFHFCTSSCGTPTRSDRT